MLFFLQFSSEQKKTRFSHYLVDGKLLRTSQMSWKIRTLHQPTVWVDRRYRTKPRLKTILPTRILRGWWRLGGKTWYHLALNYVFAVLFSARTTFQMCQIWFGLPRTGMIMKLLVVVVGYHLCGQNLPTKLIVDVICHSSLLH